MSAIATAVPGRRTIARGGVRRERHEPAYALLLAVMALTAIGIVMVYSSSSVRSYFSSADPATQGLEYSDFADAVAHRCRSVALLGETAGELERLIAGRVPTHRAADMAEAVAVTAATAQPGDVALLAPAAASFDMFVDYAARGDAFRDAVRRLENPR